MVKRAREITSGLLLRALALLLLFWQPMSFAGELQATMPSLHFRGAGAVLELLVHVVVAALSAAAGWSLWHGRAHGAVLARLALVAIWLQAVQSLYWSALPSQTPPGSEAVLASLAALHSLFWLAFLSRSPGPQEP